MNICGVLVHANPAKSDTVATTLRRLDGVEVHAAADARLVVTVEDTDGRAAIDSLAAIHRVDGVIAATLVYHHFDDGGACPDADA